MNGNNVHTSLIIELASQEEQGEEKMYKVDFNDVEPAPKDYVLDQIFCGDNLAVYALFEIPDVTNGTSDKQLVEVTNLSVSDEFKFYHRNSYKKVIGEKREEDCMSSVVECEENIDFLAVKDRKNESFYCLKQYDLPRLGEDSQELKVLYSKDIISQKSSPAKLKAVSRGVNTDVAQCPKLLDEVHRAINLNFPFVKSQGSTFEVTSLCKQSYDLIEVDTPPSSSSRSDPDANNSSGPNFVVVPLLMVEEGMLSHMQQKSQRSAENKISIAPQKTSVGINTDASMTEPVRLLSPIRVDMKEETLPPENVNNLEHQKKEAEHQAKEASKKEAATQENPETQPKIASNETILEEVKNLQWKLNTLIKSLESKDFYLNLKKEEFGNQDSKPPLKNPQPEERKLDWKSQNKFGHHPIFPPQSLSPNKLPSLRTCRQKAINRGEKKKLPMVRFSASIDSLGHSHPILHHDDPKLSSNEFVINWKNLIKWRQVGASKSESNNRLTVPEPKYPCSHPLKKSLSLDLLEEKLDVFGMKKTRNATLKLEGNLKTKANIRLKLNGETFFGDNLAFLNCEMGDEAARIIKSLQLDLSDLIGVESESIKDSALKFCKLEGDASMYQKHGLIPPKFTDKLTVHYCNADTNSAVSNSLFKSEKTLMATSKKSRNVEKNTVGGVEKSKIPNRGCNKLIIADGKKEGGVAAGQGNKTDKPVRKDTAQDMLKQKCVTASRKSSLVKGAAEVRSVTKATKKQVHDSKEYVNCHKLQQGKLSQEEKCAGKGDATGRWARPPSQKRREPTGTQSKEREAFRKDSLVLMGTDSNHASESAGSAKGNVLVSEMEMEDPGEEMEASPLGSPILMSSRNPSSVIVELFNKKPVSMEDFNFEEDQDLQSIERTPAGSVCDEKENVNNSTSCENNENSEKPIVKSVWALTKVLVYEDGTKKFEVLEASLTPPDYCLTGEKTAESKSR